MIDVFRLLANMPELVRVNGIGRLTSSYGVLLIIVIILIILIILINSLNSLPKDKETYKK